MALTLNANGSYSYVLNNNLSVVQALKPTQALIEVFTYTISDGRGGTATATLTITVNGANDFSVAVGDTAGVLENQTASALNVLSNDVDPDGSTDLLVNGNAAGGSPGSFVSVGAADVQVAGLYGTLTIRADGTYSYLATGDALGAGQIGGRYVHLPAGRWQRHSDHHDQCDRVNERSGDRRRCDGAVTEDVSVTGGELVVTGALTISDADAGQASFQTSAGSITGAQYGALTLTAAGAWTYTVNNSHAAVQALGAGQSLVESITVRAL